MRRAEEVRYEGGEKEKEMKNEQRRNEQRRRSFYLGDER